MKAEAPLWVRKWLLSPLPGQRQEGGNKNPRYPEHSQFLDIDFLPQPLSPKWRQAP